LTNRSTRELCIHVSIEAELRNQAGIPFLQQILLEYGISLLLAEDTHLAFCSGAEATYQVTLA
jgi:hypothetical protein